MTKTSEIDALFELSLADFTAARNALASRLKKEGRAAEAERVKAIAKPPATAWAVNQLFWRHRKQVERLLGIGDKVREAQAGKGGDLRELLEQRRTVVSDLTDRAEEILTAAGHAASQDARRRIATNLESLAVWGRSSDESQLGRLTADLEPLGFDGLAALLKGKPLQAKVLPFRRAEKKLAEDTAAAREKTKEAIKRAEAALTAARREAERAEAAAAKASKRALSLEKHKQEIEALYRSAQTEARAAASEAKKAAEAVADAERAVNRARDALQ